MRVGNTGLVARALAAVCIAGGLLGVVAPAAQASDDYPWAWQGQCPIVPQEPIVEPTPTPTPTPTPDPDPEARRDRPAPVEPPPPPPPPPPVFDPVTGHTYDPRGPRPTCASRVWSINGSIGDAWGFVLRNCTSFVAWRLQERNRMDGFSNSFGGEHWGERGELGRRRPPARLPRRRRAGHRRGRAVATTAASATSPG